MLVRYTPAGGTEQTAWRYDVPVAAYAGSRRTAAHVQGEAIPRTLSKLLGGLPVTIACIGDGVTVGYNATGTASGGYVARLAARLAGFLPAAQVTRYDPTGYATTLDAPIPSWTAVPVQAGATPSAQQITVVNVGVSGDTALCVLRRIGDVTSRWVPPPDCYVVLLGYGEMGGDPTRAAAPSDFAGQLSGLVDVLRGGGAEVILCTPHAGPPGAAVDSYAAAVRAVAAASGCALADLRALWLDHYDPSAPDDGYGTWLDTSSGDHVSPADAGHAAIAALFDPSGALPVSGAAGTEAVWERVRLLNTSVLLQFTGAWTVRTGFALAGLLASPREMQTATPGDRLTFSARCSEIYLLGRRWHDGGQIAVTVDGAPLGTVDLYRGVPVSTADIADPSGAIAPRERIPVALGLSDTVHTVTLQLAATANPSSQGTVWRFDALELVRLRHGGQCVEGDGPLQRLQHGTATIALAAAPSGSATITFAEPYTGALPVVIAQSPDPAYYTAVSGIGPSGATITLVQSAHAAVTDTQTVRWMAFGS